MDGIGADGEMLGAVDAGVVGFFKTAESAENTEDRMKKGIFYHVLHGMHG